MQLKMLTSISKCIQFGDEGFAGNWLFFSPMCLSSIDVCVVTQIAFQVFSVFTG